METKDLSQNVLCGHVDQAMEIVRPLRGPTLESQIAHALDAAWVAGFNEGAKHKNNLGGEQSNAKEEESQTNQKES
jgi:hypothetical protein